MRSWVGRQRRLWPTAVLTSRQRWLRWLSPPELRRLEGCDPGTGRPPTTTHHSNRAQKKEESWTRRGKRTRPVSRRGERRRGSLVNTTARVFRIPPCKAAAGAAVPGWCSQPMELHSGFCLAHASQLARLPSSGCLAGSRSPLVSKLNWIRGGWKPARLVSRRQGSLLPCCSRTVVACGRCGENALKQGSALASKERCYSKKQPESHSTITGAVLRPCVSIYIHLTHAFWFVFNVRKLGTFTGLPWLKISIAAKVVVRW